MCRLCRFGSGESGFPTYFQQHRFGAFSALDVLRLRSHAANGPTVNRPIMTVVLRGARALHLVQDRREELPNCFDIACTITNQLNVQRCASCSIAHFKAS